MGLIQEIEGLFGFGKKAGEQTKDVAAAKAAAEKLKAWLAEGSGVLDEVAPFAATNATLATFVAIARIVLEDDKIVVSALESWLPPAATPAAPPPPPAAPPPAPAK